MFTGLVETTGTLAAQTPMGGDTRLRIDTSGLNMDMVAAGDSIAVDGVCLTVVEKTRSGFEADVSLETLSRTTLGSLTPGAGVNLETSLTLDRPLGGHLVTGHVDGLAVLRERRDDARSIRMEFDAPEQYARYIAAKGAVCLNGVSLTVNDVNRARFDVNLVPHTCSVTTLGALKPGSRANLEVDIIACISNASAPPAAARGSIWTR